MDKVGTGGMSMSPLGRNVQKLPAAGSRRSLLKTGSRSIQNTQVLYKSQLNSVETFGGTLPVLVHEALTFSDKNAAASVRISNDGWAWFVCGQRLLIWQCRSLTDEAGSRTGRRSIAAGASVCRELALPSSDLAYRAELVSVYLSPGNPVPSCIASSPSGIVRYWPSISHETNSIEVNAELQGEECDSLTSISPVGCILATTTASIVLLQTQMQAGRHVISCRPMRSSHEWQLGGITKLIMPYLGLFGSNHGTASGETKLIKVEATRPVTYDQDTWILHILVGHPSLQKWIISSGETEKLLYECNIQRIAVDAFHKTIWPCAGNPNDILVWSLDMQICENGVITLVGATNPQISPQFHYALGTLITDSINPPTKFNRFFPLKYTGFYRESDEAELLNFKILLYGATVLMYNKKILLSMSAVNFGEDFDSIDFLGVNDQILGAALCRGSPVFFTKENGLVSITPTDLNRSDLLNANVSDMATGDATTTPSTSEPINVAVSDEDLLRMAESNDAVVQMEAAFLYFLRKQLDISEQLVAGLFPNEDEPAMRTDAPLDTVVVQISEQMMDEVPTGDPRWAAQKDHFSSVPSFCGSSSLQIKHQLEDKLTALEWLHSFLRHQRLWERLNNVSIRDSVLATRHVLAEHCEKLVAAVAMKDLHSSDGVLLDQIVKFAAERIEDEKPLWTGLTAQDIFYRRVSRFHIGLQAIVTWAETIANSDRRPQDVASGIANANHALLIILHAVLAWRKQNMSQFKIPPSQNIEYLPWTAASGQQGLKDSLTLQHTLTLKFGARATGDASLKGKLYEQLVQITDILLDGRRAHCESLKNLPKYDFAYQQFETTRLSLLKPFLADCEYERAAILAEKYLDFHVLIQICELTDNAERLDSYCEKFAEHNFSKYLFNWYIREGKPGRLLEKYRERSKPIQQKYELNQFLGEHPSLLWLQNIFSNKFRQSYDTLEAMARAEKDLLCRKKTMLSLAKLSILTADDEQDEVVEEIVNDLDVALKLLADQEDLPEAVISAHGYDPAKMPVLTPPEIIRLYISAENAEVIQFKRALDLLPFVEDDLERDELRLLIWCKAILVDFWTDVECDASINAILNLFLFKLMDFVDCMGGSLEELLPPIDCLLESDELGDLKSDKHFQYIIRLGYEHILSNKTTTQL